MENIQVSVFGGVLVPSEMCALLHQLSIGVLVSTERVLADREEEEDALAAERLQGGGRLSLRGGWRSQ